MAQTRTVRHVQVPTSLDWAKLAQKRWEKSPERAYRMRRAGTHAKIQAEYFAERQYPRSQQMRDERNEIQKRMQIKAEFDASQMELRYTSKQKAEIERFRMAPQLARKSGIFNKKELDQIDRNSMMGILDITPEQMFKATPWAKGEGVGDVFDKNGAKVSRKIDGETWQVDHRKTEAGQAAEHELKATQDAAKLKADIDKERRAFERDLYTKEVVSVDGLTKRSRTPDEIQQIMRGYGRFKELEEARNLVSEFREQFSSIDEIPQDMRQQFFDAVDLIEDTEIKKDTPIVNNEADYKKLPSGTRFIDPDGKERDKP